MCIYVGPSYKTSLFVFRIIQMFPKPSKIVFFDEKELKKKRSVFVHVPISDFVMLFSK